MQRLPHEAGSPPYIEGARETARRTIPDGNRASEVIKRLRGLFSRKALAAELGAQCLVFLKSRTRPHARRRISGVFGEGSFAQQDIRLAARPRAHLSLRRRGSRSRRNC